MFSSLPFLAAALGCLFSPVLRAETQTRTVWLSDLDLSSLRPGWGKPQRNRSVTKKPMTIAGRTFTRGVGTHAPVRIDFRLDGKVERFHCLVGVDGAAGTKGSIRLRLYGEDRRLFDSGVIKGGQPPRTVDVALRGHHRVVLIVDDAGDGKNFDHVDLAQARFLVAGKDPVIGRRPDEGRRIILTPKPGPAPRINGPRVYGVRPGHPVIFRIPTTGTRPLHFQAEGLPEGLTLDSATGIITGSAPRRRGEYSVTFRASNQEGHDERSFRFVVGDTIALTPPMGWNHWYAYRAGIDDALFRRAADALVASGMADVGYQYVSIDDCWMRKPGSPDLKLGGPPRDDQGRIRPNDNFPDMKALTDYIHARGLKAGIYTSPGPRTCGGYEGSYRHEVVDAHTFADWGFDFLKYDWCSYGRVAGGRSLEDLKRPYQRMGDILKSLPRDIVFNLCQYGMGEVWKWGAEVGGNSWRTAGDLGFELTRFYEVALRNAGFFESVHPGAWNDPDYLLLGHVGHRPGDADLCPLTPNEQYAYMSLWSLMAAPLFFSGDITRLDDFVLNVLCNPEVIDLNQDSLGKGGRVVRRDEETFVMVKELAGGSRGVGLFNTAPIARRVTVAWKDIGISGRPYVRDVWRQTNLGLVATEFTSLVPAGGVRLLRVRPAS